MKIDKQTKWKDVAVVYILATEQERKRVEDLCAERVLGDGGCWSLSVGDFIELAQGGKVQDFAEHGEAVAVLATFALRRWVEDLMNLLTKLVPPKSTKQISAPTLEMAMSEAMLVFTREYFGCGSFAESSKVAMADYVLARKDHYNKVVTQMAEANFYKSKK